MKNDKNIKEGLGYDIFFAKGCFDIMDDSKILYGLGIDDSVWGNPIKFAYKRLIPDLLVFKFYSVFPQLNFSKSGCAPHNLKTTALILKFLKLFLDIIYAREFFQIV